MAASRTLTSGADVFNCACGGEEPAAPDPLRCGHCDGRGPVTRFQGERPLTSCSSDLPRSFLVLSVSVYLKIVLSVPHTHMHTAASTRTHTQKKNPVEV